MYNLLSKKDFINESDADKRKRSIAADLIGSIANYVKMGVNSQKAPDFIRLHKKVEDLGGKTVDDYLTMSDKQLKDQGFDNMQVHKIKQAQDTLDKSKSKYDQYMRLYGNIETEADMDKRKKQQMFGKPPVDKEAMRAAAGDKRKDDEPWEPPTFGSKSSPSTFGSKPSDDNDVIVTRTIKGSDKKLTSKNATTREEKLLLQKQAHDKEEEKARKKLEKIQHDKEEKERKAKEREDKKLGIKRDPKSAPVSHTPVLQKMGGTKVDPPKPTVADIKKVSHVASTSTHKKPETSAKTDIHTPIQHTPKPTKSPGDINEPTDPAGKEAFAIIKHTEEIMKSTEKGQKILKDVIEPTEVELEKAKAIALNLKIEDKASGLLAGAPFRHGAKSTGFKVGGQQLSSGSAPTKPTPASRLQKRLYKSLNDLEPTHKGIIDKILQETNDEKRERLLATAFQGLERRGIVFNQKFIKNLMSQTRHDKLSVMISDHLKIETAQTKELAHNHEKTTHELSQLHNVIAGMENSVKHVDTQMTHIKDIMSSQAEVYDKNVGIIAQEIGELKKGQAEVSEIRASLGEILDNVKKGKQKLTPETEKILSEETKKLQEKTAAVEKMHEKIGKIYDDFKQKNNHDAQELTKLKIKLAETQNSKDNYDLNIQLEKERTQYVKDNLHWQEETMKRMNDLHSMEKNLHVEKERLLKDELTKVKTEKKDANRILKIIMISLGVLFLALGGFWIYKYMKRIQKKKAQISFLLTHEPDALKRSYLEYRLQQLNYKEVDLEYQASVLKMKAMYKYEGSQPSEKNQLLMNAGGALTSADIRDLERVYLI